MKTRIAVVVAAVVVVALAAYTGFWFYMAGEVKARADAFVENLTGKNIEAACADLDVGGFPATIGVSCARIAATDTVRHRSVSAGAFQSTASILRLGHITSDLDGPLKANDGKGTTLDATWGTFETQTVFWRQGLLTGSLAATEFHGTVKSPSLPGRLTVGAPVVKAKARQDKGNLEADFALSQLAIKGAGPLSAVPVTNVSGSARVNGMAKLLSGRQRLPDHLLRGTSGTLKSLTASIGNGADVSVSGPFSFDEKGRLSGQFALSIENLPAWQAAINSVLPGASEAISTATAMLTALGGSNGKASITLTAKDGRLSLGLIPIGKIPPI